MKNLFHSVLYGSLLFSIFCLIPQSVWAQDTSTTTAPVVENGMTQVIEEFSDPETWVRHDLWVETEFDSDGDGELDRMHVAVARPQQTEFGDLKLPVIYETSPYYAGTARPPYDFFWDVRQELG